MRKESLKKLFAISLTGALTASVLLTGCGSTPKEEVKTQDGEVQESTDAETVTKESAEEETKTSGETIEIKLSTTWTQGSVVQEEIENLIAKFEEEHPGVVIEHDALSTADLRTKLTVQAASGDMPDVSWCPQSYAREFIKDGLIIDWSGIVEEDPDWHAWFADPVFDALTEPDGKILLAPLEASIDGLYYNKAMFDEHGWTAPKTWDESMTLIPKIKEAGITPIVTGGKDSRFAWMASAFLVRATGLDNFKSLCYGEDMTNWNNESTGFPTAVTKFKEMVDAGAFPNGVMGMSATEADQMFANEEAAMYYEGAWKVGNFESAGGAEFLEKLDRLDWPAMTDCPDGNPDTRVGGCFIGVMVKAGNEPEKEKLCIELAKSICSPDFGIPIMEKGGQVYPGVAEYDKSTCSEIMNKMIEAFHSADSYIPSMDGIAPPAVDLAIKQTAFPGIITKELDAKQAVDEVQKAAEDYAASLETQ